MKNVYLRILSIIICWVFCTLALLIDYRFTAGIILAYLPLILTLLNN